MTDKFAWQFHTQPEPHLDNREMHCPRGKDQVEYEFVVANPEKGWANDVQIKDVMSNVQVEVIGGDVESAFVSSEISHDVSNGIDADADTYVPDYNSNSNLNIETDIAAGEVLTFNATGIIRDDAIQALKSIGFGSLGTPISPR